MKNILKKTVVAVALVAALVGCERIQTGEVGIRINASREVQGNELVPGSWNQTVVGQVLTFPVVEAVKNGKVNTIIIPHNLTMLGSLPK